MKHVRAITTFIIIGLIASNAFAFGWLGIVASGLGGYVLGRISSNHAATSSRTTYNTNYFRPSPTELSNVLTEALVEATNVTNKAAELRDIERKMKTNKENFDRIQSRLNDRVDAIVAVQHGVTLCTAFCGSFNDQGTLSIKGVLGVGANAGVAYGQLEAQCAEDDKIIFSEMWNTGWTSRTSGQSEPVQVLIPAASNVVCDVIP